MDSCRQQRRHAIASVVALAPHLVVAAKRRARCSCYYIPRVDTQLCREGMHGLRQSVWHLTPSAPLQRMRQAGLQRVLQVTVLGQNWQERVGVLRLPNRI